MGDIGTQAKAFESSERRRQGDRKSPAGLGHACGNVTRDVRDQLARIDQARADRAEARARNPRRQTTERVAAGVFASLLEAWMRVAVAEVQGQPSGRSEL